MSENSSEADTICSVIKGCTEQIHLAVGIVGYGSDSFLNAILESSLEDETTCSLVEHPDEEFHRRSPSLDAMDVVDIYLTKKTDEQPFIINNEKMKNTNGNPRIIFKYGTCPELFAQFKKDFRNSSSLLKGKVLVGQRARYVGPGKDTLKDLLYLRQKLHMLQENFSEQIESIEFRLPVNLLRGNREFIFYGTDEPRCDDFSVSKLLGVHCLICVVGEQGLNPSLRNFLVQSGFLDKLIRHPLDFQILFLVDQSNLVSFTVDDIEAILRQQYVALLKEHAPGPYAITTPKLAATTKILPIQPQNYVELCRQQSSYQSKQQTGIPNVICTIQNMAICNCADSITNISQDWRQKASRIRSSSSSVTSTSPSIQTQSKNETLSPTSTVSSSKLSSSSSSSIRSHSRRVVSETLSGDLLSAFRVLKEELIAETKNIDLILAKGAKQSFSLWNQIHPNSFSYLNSTSLCDDLQKIICESLTATEKTLFTKKLFAQKIPQQLKIIEKSSASLLSDCLRSIGSLNNSPSDAEKARIKKLAEFANKSHTIILGQIEKISSILNLGDPKQFLIRSCQHVLIFSSLQKSSVLKSSSTSSFLPSLSADIISYLPLKAIQRIRMQFADLSTEILSILSSMESSISCTQNTILQILQFSLNEQQNQSHSKQFISSCPPTPPPPTPPPPTSTTTTPGAFVSFLPFKPFTNLIFDTTDWSLLSCMSLSLLPNIPAFEQQLKNHNLTFILNNNNTTTTTNYNQNDNQNSLFRSLSYQIYGNEALYPIVRFLLCNEILKNKRIYEPYFYASHYDIQEYVHRMSMDGEPGDHITLLAFANYYKVHIWLYSPVLQSPVFIASSDRKTASLSPPCYLAYHTGKYYSTLQPNYNLIYNNNNSESSSSSLLSKKRKFVPSESYLNDCDNVPISKKQCLLSIDPNDDHENEKMEDVDKSNQNICDEDEDMQEVVTNSIVSRRKGGGILSLVELCTFAIAQNVHLLPDLGGCVSLDVVQPIIRNLIQMNKFSDEILQKLIGGNLFVDAIDVSNSRQMDYSCCTVIAQHRDTLSYLDISSCDRIPEEGFKVLINSLSPTSINHLQYLNLSGCSQLSNLSLQQIASHSPKLRNICLDHCIEVRDTSIYDLLENCKHLEFFSCSGCLHITDKAFTHSTSPLQIKNFNLENCLHLTDESIINIAQRCGDNLQSIVISGKQIGDPSAQALAGFCSTNLLSLKMIGTSITDMGLRCLSIRCESLETLHIPNSSLLSPLMFHPNQGTLLNSPDWKPFISLRELNISTCENVNDTTLNAIAHWLPSEIYHLDLHACEKISDRGLNQILQHSCKFLSTLNLSQCRLITDVSVVQIALSCTQITFLSLYNCKEITDLSLEYLSSHLTHLQFLDLSCCTNLTDNGFSHLAFPSLITLNLEETLISDKILSLVISRCCLLQNVNFAYCKFLSSETMKTIASTCKDIQSIDISYCNSISVDCLQDTLNELPNLQELQIRGYINLKQSLFSHSSLRRLNISWCKELRDEAFQRLFTQLPSLEHLDASWCSSLSLHLLQRVALSLKSIVVKGF